MAIAKIALRLVTNSNQPESIGIWISYQVHDKGHPRRQVIQYFIPGRHGDAGDVIADMCGAGLGLAAVLAILNF